MATASQTTSRWSRALVAASALWLVCWQAAAVAGLPRRVEIPLALYGFVFHVVFGKAYSLVPSYFDRNLRPAHAPTVQLPLAVVGTAGLAAGGLAGVPRRVSVAGAACWAAGVAVFVGAVLWTVRGNLTGAQTGTGDHNAHRRRVDRLANAAVPVVVLYLLAGAYGTLAAVGGLPLALYLPRVSHLLAAGAAALMLFAVGFRLFPRFLVSAPPRSVVGVVLVSGALGPALIAAGLPAGPLLHAGAALETIALVGFAASYLTLFARSDRDRIGFYVVTAGMVGGLLAVSFGLTFAISGVEAGLVRAHYRLALLGFLGLTIVGVTYQFYPPTVARFPLAGDRFALGVALALGGGLLVEVAGLLAGMASLSLVGRVSALAGAIGYAYLLVGLFVQRALS